MHWARLLLVVMMILCEPVQLAGCEESFVRVCVCVYFSSSQLILGASIVAGQTHSTCTSLEKCSLDEGAVNIKQTLGLWGLPCGYIPAAATEIWDCLQKHS